MPDLPIAVSPSDIDPQWVADGYRNVTMSDLGRLAASTQRDYVAHITSVCEDLLPLAETDEQLQALATGLDAYQQRWIALFRAWMHAKSRTASAMVTGRAKFNFARNEKRMQSDDKRREELIEHQKRGPKQLRKELLALESIEAAEERRLRDAAERVVETLARIEDGTIKWANAAAFRRSLAGKLRASHANGHAEAVQSVLQALPELEASAGLKSPVFAARNAVWRLA
jgi:hypothetical protein